MSMTATLVLASDEAIRQLLADPGGIREFFKKERSSLDLDKAWHGIHFLLTGSAWEGEEPLCYLVCGGEEIGDADFGYGPARALESGRVAAFDEALSGLSRDELSRRFDPKAMLEAEIYPGIWGRDPSEDNAAEYLLSYFGELKEFVSSARSQNSGLIIFLS